MEKKKRGRGKKRTRRRRRKRGKRRRGGEREGRGRRERRGGREGREGRAAAATPHHSRSRSSHTAMWRCSTSLVPALGRQWHGRHYNKCLVLKTKT